MNVFFNKASSLADRPEIVMNNSLSREMTFACLRIPSEIIMNV